MKKKSPYRPLAEKLASLEKEFDFCNQLFSSKQWEKIQKGFMLLYKQIIKAAACDDYREDDFNFADGGEKQVG